VFDKYAHQEDVSGVEWQARLRVCDGCILCRFVQIESAICSLGLKSIALLALFLLLRESTLLADAKGCAEL
jgi:hypothetical protein